MHWLAFLAFFSFLFSFLICTWQQNDFPSCTFYVSCQKLNTCSCYSRVFATKAAADNTSLCLTVSFSAWTPSLLSLSLDIFVNFSSNLWLCTKSMYKRSHSVLDNSAHQTVPSLYSLFSLLTLRHSSVCSTALCPSLLR